MSAWNQKRRDPKTLEERRIRGVRMIVEQKLSEHEVARRLGVSQGAVSMWYAAYRNGGHSYDALSPKKHTGRIPRLNTKQLGQIPKILARGAIRYGFETDLSTAQRVSKVIRDRFNISYSDAQTVRILHRLGFSWQKPEGVAREFDEDNVKEWVVDVLPKIKKAERYAGNTAN